MAFTIYIDHKPLSLTNDVANIGTKDETCLVAFIADLKEISKLLLQLSNNDYTEGVFIYPNEEALQAAVFAQYEMVEAAGGVVLNENKEILLIFRRGFWDLPKGKIDEGETIEQTAIREVQEETGLSKIALGEKIMTTYHSYEYKGIPTIKPSHWFYMQQLENEILVPQTEEDIEDLKWVALTDLESYKKNMYPSLLDVLDKVTTAHS